MPLEIPSKVLSSVQHELARRAEQSLGSFIRQGWPVLEPGTRFTPGWHLEAIVEHLEAVKRGEVRNLLINLPPRHMKSLAVSVFWPVWEWLTSPQRRWLFTSYALSLSIRDSLKCRRLITSSWFQGRWGSRFRLTGDQNSKMRFDNDQTGYRLATSVGGAATGEGGDRVVVDDPHNVREAESRAMRESTLLWWDQTMSTRMNDPKTGARVIVMQRLHERDLSGHVLGQGGYMHLCLPAEFEPHRRCQTSIGWKDPRESEGELLWPARIGPDEIADFKRRLGPVGYAGQFQQRPAPAEGARFRAEWFRYYEFAEGGCPADSIASDLDGRPADRTYKLLQPDDTFREVSESDCNRFAVMDPAGTDASDNARACYTVIQVWDVTPAGDMILVHQYRRQVQTPDAADAAVCIARSYGVAYLGVEREGLGLGIVQSVRRRGIAVKALCARGSKEARSQTAEIRMAAGTVYFPQAAPFLWELQRELLHFPNAEHADQVDALAHAAIEVQRRGIGATVGAAEPDPPSDDWEPE